MKHEDGKPDHKAPRTVKFAGTGANIVHLIAYLAEQGEISRLKITKIPEVDSEHGIPLYEGDELHDYDGNKLEGIGARPPRAVEEERRKKREESREAINQRLTIGDWRAEKKRERRREADRRRREKKRRARYTEIKSEKGKAAADRWLATNKKQQSAARRARTKKGKK